MSEMYHSEEQCCTSRRMNTCSKSMSSATKKVCSYCTTTVIHISHSKYIVRRVIRSSPAKQLTSTKILAQRSAVPAVISRTLPSSKHENRAKLSQKEKTRLFRITKRHRSGPFNTAEDSTTFGNGSALLEISAAVKSSGHYDAWAPAPAIELAEGLETVYKPLIKVVASA